MLRELYRLSWWKVAALTIYVSTILSQPLGASSDLSHDCFIDRVADWLPQSDLGDSVYPDAFLRLFTLANGMGDEIPTDSPYDSLYDRMVQVGIIPGGFEIHRERAVTLGEVSLLVTKSLLKDKGSLIERLMLSVFGSQSAALRIASREHLVPDGASQDVITYKECAAIILAIAAFRIDHPMDGSNTECLMTLLEEFPERVITANEIKQILDMPDSSFVEAILAL